MCKLIGIKIYIYGFNVQYSQYLQSQVQVKPFTYSFTGNTSNTIERCKKLSTRHLGFLQEDENAHKSTTEAPFKHTIFIQSKKRRLPAWEANPAFHTYFKALPSHNIFFMSRQFISPNPDFFFKGLNLQRLHTHNSCFCWPGFCMSVFILLDSRQLEERFSSPTCFTALFVHISTVIIFCSGVNFAYLGARNSALIMSKI